MMNFDFTSPDASIAHVLEPYFSLRPNKTCDSGLLDTYIWKQFYQIRTCIVDEKAVLFLMQNEGEYFSAMPYCRAEDLPYYFGLIQSYFNEQLKKPLKIYLADEEGVMLLGLCQNPDYLVREEEDLKDYLYSGDDLRSLSGKKYQQKRNQIHHFERAYEGRWAYQTFRCQDRSLILDFLNRWFDGRSDESAESLAAERSGIEDIIADCCRLSYRMGGILIDGKLEALSIGTFNPRENMAVISVEKANPAIPGIYQLINQQFLLHEFPDAELVNREDDMGLPGLRQAKRSYHPIGYARKYMILQKHFAGYREEMEDYYENEIHSHADLSGREGSDTSAL